MFCAISWITASSLPFTLIPTGVWIPVSCIRTRVLIGWVQLFT